MSGSISRRQWLVASGLGATATLAAPQLLSALSSTKVREAAMYGPTDYVALEREATAMRRAAGPIRLAFNENPFGMSPKAKAAIMSSWDQHNKYGLPALGELRKTFAAAVGVAPENVLVTQGSGEVLDIAALAYSMHGGEIVSAWPTFEGLPRYAESIGATVHKVPLDKNLGHNFEMMDRQTTNAVDLVYVCNPNNPTGTLSDTKTLHDFVASVSKRAVVVVDEAYHDFVDEPSYKSCIDMVLKGENVIVARTASKIHGMAAMRIGFAIARPDIIERLQKVATGTPNIFGVQATMASIGDTEYQTFVKTKNREGRALLTAALTKLGKKVAPSQANFLYFDAGMNGESVRKAALAKGYMIGRAFAPYNDWVRVSIGTPEEMQGFVSILPDALKPAMASGQ
jgi:histidinol-phosphate aminotransferase